MKRSTWLHLRIPFSVYLLPIFCFAVSQAPQVDVGKALLIAVILHLLAYPASQGFNSYYDRDRESIGGLEHPPPVTPQLLGVSLAFDAVALLLGLLVGWRFSFLLLLCGLASKAYSHPAIRLKARPWAGWLAVTLFQGALTYAMVTLGLRGLPLRDLWSRAIVVPASLISLLVGGAYPMTQIYQHREDAARGDMTLSRLLGVRATFVFCGLALFVSTVGFFWHFSTLGRIRYFWLMVVFLLPVALYFQSWFTRVRRDHAQADFRSAMTLNKISALSLVSYFAILTWLGP